MRTIAFACVSLLALASTGGAQATQSTTKPSIQSQLPLAPGMRVRVTASNLVTPLVANYLENSADTLKFVEGRGVWSLTLDQITKLEVTIGEQTHHTDYMLKYGAIGAGAGALTFGFFAANNKPSDKTKDYSLISSAALGILVGGVIGAYVGSRAHGEKWRPLPLPKKLAFGPDAWGHWHLSSSFTF